MTSFSDLPVAVKRSICHDTPPAPGKPRKSALEAMAAMVSGNDGILDT